jgi:hypothetical protein
MRTEQRAKMMEHLEAALALADQTQDGMARWRIEQAIDELVTAEVSALDPRTDISDHRRAPPGRGTGRSSL